MMRISKLIGGPFDGREILYSVCPAWRMGIFHPVFGMGEALYEHVEETSQDYHFSGITWHHSREEWEWRFGMTCPMN